MSAMTSAEIPLDTTAPAQRLRRLAAAVRVQFTWWGIHRSLTAQQKEEVGDTCGADARFLTAGKKIIDVRHEAYRQLTSLRSRITKYWHGLTLPHVEPGIRLIRQTDIEAFEHTLEGLRDELTAAESELNTVYEQMKSDARRRLGKLYNPADYPAEIRGLFVVAWDLPSVEPPSYLMRLSPELYAQEQQRLTQRFEEAVRLAEQAFVSEFASLVSHLTERLTGGADADRKVFRDSAITNLVDFFEKFRNLNVGSNAQLDALVEQAQQVIRGVGPQTLRDNDGLRRHVATQLSQVQSGLDGMLVDRPRRRLIRTVPVRNGDAHATVD